MLLSLLVFTGLFVLPCSAVLRLRDSRRGTFCRRKDHVLKSHVVAERDVKNEFSCTIECVAEPRCRSVNLKKVTNSSSVMKCQLNNATRFSAKKEDYEENMEYNHVFDSDDIPVSCSQIKVSVPSSASGYYSVRDFSAKCLTRLVYCDMENDGGGWTLVASVSNTNNNHLQTTKVNCLNSSLCVENANNTNIQTRKMVDNDIRIMAHMEGVFRVNVLKSTPYRVFFKIPSGSQFFDSSCDGNSCPRIITSHNYPYVWESSCKGTSMGYAIGYSPLGMDCYHVFDNESPHDCAGWSSSKYATERGLYGFTCWGNKGIFFGLNGFLFVK